QIPHSTLGAAQSDTPFGKGGCSNQSGWYTVQQYQYRNNCTDPALFSWDVYTFCSADGLHNFYTLYPGDTCVPPTPPVVVADGNGLNAGPCNVCNGTNPINSGWLGNKYEREDDYLGSGTFPLRL